MNPNTPVTLFVQCLVDKLYPQAALSMVKIFNTLDIPLEIPPRQTCCGQPAFNSGYTKQTVRAAKKFIATFENSRVIVCPSGSCVDMVKHQYPLLFEEGSAWYSRAMNISKKIYELSQYLVDVLKIDDLGAVWHGKLTYHDSCHLYRNLGIFDQPRKLISKIKGATLVEMKHSTQCCGFGGTFSIKYPDISAAILEEKVNHIIASGAKAVVGCDVSCLMNVQGMLSRKNSNIQTFHIAEILAPQR